MYAQGVNNSPCYLGRPWLDVWDIASGEVFPQAMVSGVALLGLALEEGGGGLVQASFSAEL